MGESLAARRTAAVGSTVAAAQRIIATAGVDRASLESVLDELKRLASRTELWGESDFPAPELPDRQARYLIDGQPDWTYTLYLNVMRPGNRTPVHNHTTWACIAAVEGTEYNYVYNRLDDGMRPGHAEIKQADTVVVSPGRGIALMPEDIHAVHIQGDQVIRHLHLYGLALEALDQRVMFDPETSTTQPMRMSVQTRRANPS